MGWLNVSSWELLWSSFNADFLELFFTLSILINLREYLSCRKWKSSSYIYPSFIWSSGCLARAMMESLIATIWEAFLLALLSLLSLAREFAFPISRNVSSDSYFISFLCLIFRSFWTLFIFRCTFLIQQWKWFLMELIVLNRKPCTLMVGRVQILTTWTQSQHTFKIKYPLILDSTL